MIFQPICLLGTHCVLDSSVVQPAGHGKQTELFSAEMCPTEHFLQTIPSILKNPDPKCEKYSEVGFCAIFYPQDKGDIGPHSWLYS